MKKLILITTALALALAVRGQNRNDADFRLGNGLTIRLNDGDYTFNLGGFIQSTFQHDNPPGGDTETRFGIKRSFMSLSGDARRERVHFLLQVDFARNSPLLDAWVAYTPWSFLTLSAGQKQAFSNNREMILPESRLAMTDRSLLSRVLSGAGREFGLFAEGRFTAGGIVVISPALSVTSGDGLNAFGTSSIDVDFGGVKYGGRLDIAPLGSFSDGNDDTGADIARERSPKLKIGVAASYNTGASHANGEGHGAFTLYDDEGRAAYPDYRKLYVDLLFKYRGLSLLAEYANTTATSLEGLYTAAGGNAKLVPGQVSHYLYLGNSYNLQAGYLLPSGWALDLRYTRLAPEFDGESASLLRETEAVEGAISKYFVDNRLKIQGGVSHARIARQGNHAGAELLLQVVF